MSDIGYRVRTELARYLAREISLGEFVQVFLPLSWTASAAEEHAIGDLLHEIELRLAEHSNSHLTEEELRQHLTRLFERYSVVFSLQPRTTTIQTASSSAAQAAAPWSVEVMRPASRWSIAVRAPTPLPPEPTKTA
jgi:hypothetical protein